MPSRLKNKTCEVKWLMQHISLVIVRGNSVAILSVGNDNNNDNNNNSNLQKNSKCSLCSDRDETINLIIRLPSGLGL